MKNVLNYIVMSSLYGIKEDDKLRIHNIVELYKNHGEITRDDVLWLADRIKKDLVNNSIMHIYNEILIKALFELCELSPNDIDYIASIEIKIFVILNQLLADGSITDNNEQELIMNAIHNVQKNTELSLDELEKINGTLKGLISTTSFNDNKLKILISCHEYIEEKIKVKQNDDVIKSLQITLQKTNYNVEYDLITLGEARKMGLIIHKSLDNEDDTVLGAQKNYSLFPGRHFQPVILRKNGESYLLKMDKGIDE